ncbi:MAG: amidohydrolase family protein [Pirellulaceae bacterium]|nr:amidohydrolase family protein [Pirellulaceae bacterium]
MAPRSALPPIGRRTWLQAAAGTVLSAATQSLPRVHAAEVPDLAQMYIDAHSHVWSPDTDRWPLAKAQTKADLKPPSFTPEELLKLAEPEGVGRVVLIQHSVYHYFDNTYLLDCARRLPGRFAVTAMLDDTQPHPDVKLRELLPLGVRGLRITPRIRGEKWLAGSGMAALWKTGGETGQAMCCLIDPEHLPGVAAMCGQFPDTPVVIDHFARIGADGAIRDSDLANLCALAKHQRVFVKLSAYYALGKKAPPYDDLLPMLRRVLDAFGPERCMWASDAPYQVVAPHTYRESIALVRDRAGLSDGDKQWLLRKTAEQVYFS